MRKIRTNLISDDDNDNYSSSDGEDDRMGESVVMAALAEERAALLGIKVKVPPPSHRPSQMRIVTVAMKLLCLNKHKH